MRENIWEVGKLEVVGGDNIWRIKIIVIYYLKILWICRIFVEIWFFLESGGDLGV